MVNFSLNSSDLTILIPNRISTCKITTNEGNLNNNQIFTLISRADHKLVDSVWTVLMAFQLSSCLILRTKKHSCGQ